jgi:protein SCO1/2
MQAGGLTAISSALNPGQAATVVKVGEPVPDFTLTDQSGEQIHLSQFRNKVVALTFGYSRYPIPTTAGACRTTLQAWNAASQAVLGATSSSSPSTRTRQWKDPCRLRPGMACRSSKWHCLSGSKPEVKHVASLFGMDFWRDEGLLTHSLHTVIIDPSGQLAVNLEGNSFTARQVGDLVESQLDHGK